MAVPKRKLSRARRDRRRANWKLTPKPGTRCPQCGATILPHRACPACGQYQGQQVLTIKEKHRES